VLGREDETPARPERVVHHPDQPVEVDDVVQRQRAVRQIVGASGQVDHLEVAAHEPDLVVVRVRPRPLQHPLRQVDGQHLGRPGACRPTGEGPEAAPEVHDTGAVHFGQQRPDRRPLGRTVEAVDRAGQPGVRPEELRRVVDVLPHWLTVGRRPARQPRAELREVTDFGPNPANVGMFIYVPDELAEPAPVVVSMHGCGGTASFQLSTQGWRPRRRA
jgi:hypothetical protein